MPPLSSSKSDMSASTLFDFESWRRHKAADILPLLEELLAETRSLRANFLRVRKSLSSSKAGFRKGRSRLLVAARQGESERFNIEAAAIITEGLGHLFGLIKKYRSELDRLDSSLNDLVQRNDASLLQLAVALRRIQSCLRSFTAKFADDASVARWPLPMVSRDQFEDTMDEFQKGVDIISEFLDTLDVLENRAPELESPPSPHVLLGRSTWPALQDYTSHRPVEIIPWLAGVPLHSQEDKHLNIDIAVEHEPAVELETRNEGAAKKRLVFLATRRLEQSEMSKWVDEKVEEEKENTSIEDYLATQRRNPMDTFSHWAVYVWDSGDAFSGTLFELRQESAASKAFKQPGSILRETVNGNLRWSLRPFRHSVLTDEAIFDFANAVIAKYGENYDFASANCQVFANTLAQCIAQPMRREYVFQAIALLPRAHAGAIFKRRCQEWVDVKAEFGPSTLLFMDLSAPMAIDIFLDVVIPPVMALLLVWAFAEYYFLGKLTWRLLLLNSCLCVTLPYARGPLRFYGRLMRDAGKTWQDFRNPNMRRHTEESVQEEFIRATLTKDIKDIDIGDIQSQFAASRQTQFLFRT